MLNRQLVPGQLLNRRQVADEVGVSLAPSAEAFVRLQSEGLLQPIGKRGTQVRLLNRQEVRDQVVLRLALECQAARMYCGLPLRRAKARIMQLARLSDATPPMTPQDYKLEVELHLALAELSGCDALVKALRRVLRVGLFLSVEILIPPVLSAEPNHHVELIEAMVNASPDQADALMRKDLEQCLVQLDQTIQP